MLSFVFAGLAALLDQFFKRWSVIRLVEQMKTVECEVTGLIPCNCGIELIPGVIRLRYLENDGAMFGFMSGQRWVLVGVMLVSIVVLIFILLRYNEGFWGTLGLASVLGGAVGNFIDRVRFGYVVDMFEFEFVRFAVFNIADIFITLGAITFIISYIIATFRTGKDGKRKAAPAMPGVSEGFDEMYDYEHHVNQAAQYGHDGVQAAQYGHNGSQAAQYGQDARQAARYGQSDDIRAVIDSRFDGDFAAGYAPDFPSAEPEPEPESNPQISLFPAEPEAQPEVSELLEGLESLELDLTHDDIVGNDDMDKLLRDYGFENGNN